MTQADGLARLAEVQRLTGLSRSTIYRLESLSAIHFPRRVKVGPRAVAWVRADVLDWCANRPNATSNQAA